MTYENPEGYPSEYSDYYFTEEDFILSMDANPCSTFSIPSDTAPPPALPDFDDDIPF